MTYHDDIREALDEFAKGHLTDEYLLQCDREKRYPLEAMAALGTDGWSAVSVSEEFGGSGGTIADLAVIHETLTRHSLAVAQAYLSLWVLGTGLISREGSQSQKETWLPRIARRETNVTFALTEPGSGSDAAALRTSAADVDGALTATGQKVFISSAKVSDSIITAVRTARSRRRRDGISLPMIDPRGAGGSLVDIPKIGLCEVFYDSAPVIADSVVGQLHGGRRALRSGLAMLTSLLNHGFVATTVTASRYIASRNPQFIPAVAGGLLATGSNTLSPEHAFWMIDESIDLQDKGDLSPHAAAKIIVARMRQNRQRFPRFGHPTHRDGDFRATKFFPLAQELELSGAATSSYLAIHQEFAQVPGREDIPVNIDGCLGMPRKRLGAQRQPDGRPRCSVSSSGSYGSCHQRDRRRQTGKPLRFITDGKFIGSSERVLSSINDAQGIDTHV